MTREKKKLGVFGEKIAADFLQEKGFRIITTNFSCPLGELDMVAEKGPYLVFIEVRTRSGYSFGLAEESIDLRKRKKIRRLAQVYLSCYNGKSNKIRFDVVAVQVDKKTGKVKEVRHITSAF